MSQPNDLSRSLSSFVQGNTLVAVIELSLSSWLVAGVVPGVERQPLKKLALEELRDGAGVWVAFHGSEPARKTVGAESLLGPAQFLLRGVRRVTEAT